MSSKLAVFSCKVAMVAGSDRQAFSERTWLCSGCPSISDCATGLSGKRRGREGGRRARRREGGGGE